jgi:4-hydroxythreonine-4-phosphate dehydrogenase
VNAPRILVTMGDAAGIGPEVIVKALAEPLGEVRVAVVGSPVVLARATAAVRATTGDPLPRFTQAPEPFAWPDEPPSLGNVPLLPCAPELDNALARTKTPDEATGRAAALAIERAVALVREGRADAVVTAPISKEALHKAGFVYPGQTEYLAELTGATRVCMAFVSDALRVALVTTHLPLRDVPDSVTPERVAETIVVFDEALRNDFAIAHPRIGVCAVNPHAGESGLFGTEDSDRVAPGVQRARTAGVAATGPHPADALFRRAVSGEFDGVVAMYHDQGLAPVKALGISVNVTLGLPIVRTSPDHGTALDIAGRGIADARPMRAAILTAARMATARRAAGTP